MVTEFERFFNEHIELSRRYFLRCGIAGTTALASWPLMAANHARHPVLQQAIDELEPFLTTQDDFRDVSRGKPIPHELPAEKKREVGMTRDTWSLEVLSDPDNPARLRTPLTKENGSALDFAGLMQLAEKNSVRFAKVMTCLNIGCPLGPESGKEFPCGMCSGSRNLVKTCGAFFTTDITTTTRPRCFVVRFLSIARWKIILICRRFSCATSSTAIG